MGYVKTEKPVRLPLPSDPTQWWVDMRPRVLWGDVTEAQKAMLQVVVTGDSRSANVAFNEESGKGLAANVKADAYQTALVLGMVVAWNLTDENDAPLPITAESLAQLEDVDGDFLVKEVNRRSSKRAAKDTGPFGKQSSSSSRETQSTPALQ